ncbi:MAG: hypothetical protein ABSA76_13080 [Bacteroidales bacterium]
MSYLTDNADPSLRFGDIIEGFQLIKPIFNSLKSSPSNFNLEIEKVLYFTILTPCCSIEDGQVNICPLKQVGIKLFDNPYLKEDLSNINRIMLPTQAVPPEIWEMLNPEEQTRRTGDGRPSYYFVNLFIYEEHESLPKYDLIHPKTRNKVTTGYYMIDFKDNFMIRSKEIDRGKSFPKILQLSIKTRDELRKKIAFYYGRPPDEDR